MGMTNGTSAASAVHKIREESVPDVFTASSDYATRFEGAVGAWLLKVQEEAVMRMVAPWPGARVLEVGGAHGQVTGALVAAGYDVTIIGSVGCPTDRIQPLLEQGRCRFTEGDLFYLPYADRSFDIVIALRLLAHLKPREPFIAELARVARTAVIVDYASNRSINALSPWLFQMKRWIEGSARPYSVLSMAEVLRAFAAHGFAAGCSVGQFALPIVLHRAVRAPWLSRSAEGVCRWLKVTNAIGSPIILQVVRAAERT